jgi:hypothetical protein
MARGAVCSTTVPAEPANICWRTRTKQVVQPARNDKPIVTEPCSVAPERAPPLSLVSATVPLAVVGNAGRVVDVDELVDVDDELVVVDGGGPRAPLAAVQLVRSPPIPQISIDSGAAAPDAFVDEPNAGEPRQFSPVTLMVSPATACPEVGTVLARTTVGGSGCGLSL